MSNKTFSLAGGVIFLLIAIGHLLRVVFGWTFIVGGVSVPMWASGLAVLIAGFLAYEGIRLSTKTESAP